jgi:hypothetical protein
MSGRGRGLGSGFRRGRVHSVGDFGDGCEGGFNGWIEGDDRHEIGEEDGTADDAGDYGDDGDLGFGVEEEAAHAASRSVRQRGRGGRAGGQRGASFTARSVGRPTSKGKNFQAEEEVQLTCSVLAISQDPIVGNQQKGSAFWDRIHEHFKLHRPGTDRTARSLDSKWRNIKHDIGEFMGCHKQVKKNKPTGTSAADIIRLAKLMFQVKSAKGSEFTFEHCWILVKDFPRWADRWGTMKQTTPSKRRASSSAHDSVEETQEGTSAVEGNGELAGNAVLRNRPIGTKSAKASQKAEKEKEGAAYRQAQATTLLAEATVAKNVLLAEKNLLILMTTPDSQIGGGVAQRFIRMQQEEELQKYEARKEEDRLKLQKEADEQEVVRVEAARLEGERSAREEAEFAETVRQVDERAAAMAAEGDGSEFGENIHYPSSPEEFGQPPNDAAIWDDEIGLGTSSDFIEEIEEQNLWGLSGGRIYGSAVGGLYGGTVGGRGGLASGRRGPAGGHAAGDKIHYSQGIGPGRRRRGRRAGRRGASCKAGQRGTGRKCGRRGASQGSVGQGGGRTKAAGGACQDRRGAGRRKETEAAGGTCQDRRGRREEPAGLGGRESEHNAYIGGGAVCMCTGWAECICCRGGLRGWCWFCWVHAAQT